MTRIGIELEYPVADSFDRETKLRTNANKSRSLYEEADGDMGFRDSRITYDGTVGCEIVSTPLELEDSTNWYVETIERVEDSYNYPFAPTSLINGGSTAGLHLHLSPLSTEQARDLYEMSKEPWMQVFACSAVTEDRAPEYPVFRNNYCNLSFNEGRYSVLNQRDGYNSDHWEWRLPEPVLPEHFSKMEHFLDLFMNGQVTEAKAFARASVEDGEGITSITRAETIDVPWEEEEGESEWSVTREAHPETEGWFQSVRMSDEAPYIYLVQGSVGDFYGFHSHRPDPLTIDGVAFNRETVLWADDLERVHNFDIVQEVRDAVREHRGDVPRPRSGPRPSPNPESKELLKEIVEKKK